MNCISLYSQRSSLVLILSFEMLFLSLAEKVIFSSVISNAWHLNQNEVFFTSARMTRERTASIYYYMSFYSMYLFFRNKLPIVTQYTLLGVGFSYTSLKSKLDRISKAGLLNSSVLIVRTQQIKEQQLTGHQKCTFYAITSLQFSECHAFIIFHALVSLP